jgi:hypothetical protein
MLLYLINLNLMEIINLNYIFTYKSFLLTNDNIYEHFVFCKLNKIMILFVSLKQ